MDRFEFLDHTGSNSQGSTGTSPWLGSFAMSLTTNTTNPAGPGMFTPPPTPAPPPPAEPPVPPWPPVSDRGAWRMTARIGWTARFSQAGAALTVTF